jgi:hypothetical protein
VIRHGLLLIDPADGALRVTAEDAFARLKSRRRAPKSGQRLAKLGRSAIEQPHLAPKSGRSALRSIRNSDALLSAQTTPKFKSP